MRLASCGNRMLYSMTWDLPILGCVCIPTHCMTNTVGIWFRMFMFCVPVAVGAIGFEPMLKHPARGCLRWPLEVPVA